jgi:hypothetical protein
MLGEEFQFGGCPNGLDRQPVGFWGELRELLNRGSNSS